MKRIFFALPLAMLFANCSTQHSTTASVNSGTNSSASASASASTSMANSGSATANVTTSASNSPYAGYDVTKYDPNNYMQNPEKYKSPRDLVKTGGWTYNTDWNKNTNFLAEALGQWMLQPTPEVAAFWIPDSSRADTYAAYWAPEAVAARQQAKMMAANAYRDSIAQAQGMAQTTTANGTMKNTANAISGSGSTGTMGSGGTSASNNTNAGAENTTSTNGQSGATSSSASETKNYLMAVNGNMFQAPRLNLYLQNGTFVGYTGSNQLVGTLKVDGTQLHFDQAIPSTNMSATGGFSQAAFMERLGRVDSYDITDGQLRLKQGNDVLFVLAKNAQQ
jgi:heat shock protein HslJ